MGRRLKASIPATTPKPGPVTTRKVHPRYIVCAKCTGKVRLVFHRRRDWEDHMLRRHNPWPKLHKA